MCSVCVVRITEVDIIACINHTVIKLIIITSAFAGELLFATLRVVALKSERRPLVISKDYLPA